MQSDKKSYFLDFNHSPNLYVAPTKLVADRLRSGDEKTIEELASLDTFFAHEFGYESASFLDFSPYSIALFLDFVVPKDKKIAVSSKLSYFCLEAVNLLKAKGRDIVYISAQKDGSLFKSSMVEAKKAGAEYLFCAAVDEDSFFVEDMNCVAEFFEAQKTILDISNAVKKSDFPKVLAAIFWGYKLGSFKASGIALHDDAKAARLESIDLCTYTHLKEAYEAYMIDDEALAKRDAFVFELKSALKDEIFLFVEPSKCLLNSVCIGFRGIKARDFIRTLALENIFVTNGELCSLAMSKPSRILSTLGFSEEECRNAISFSFDSLSMDEIKYLASKIIFKYRQIKAIMLD